MSRVDKNEMITPDQQLMNDDDSQMLDFDENSDLLEDIKSSIMQMQDQMQTTYNNLAKTKLVGMSHDKSVTITMSATYEFEDFELDPRTALQGGIKEFKWRIREAWKDLSEKIQKMTQSKTVELLQSMQIPDEIKNISLDEDEDKGGNAGDVKDNDNED